MTKIVSIPVIIAFLGMAVFSIFLMATAMTGHGNCLAEFANGGTCPSGSPFSYLAFHFDAFKLFSTATFTIGLIAVFIVLGTLIIFGLPKLASPEIDSNYLRFSRSLNFVTPPFKKQLIRWLAFHKNSPSR